jgi:hypothetical protein
MHISDAVRTLERELREIFGARLESLVAYAAVDGRNAAAPTLVVIDHLSAEDLRACATRAAGWHDQGLATPLLLEGHEFGRSLDAFPFEFGAILADHVVVSGSNPFHGLRVDTADLRRACEVQARGHLLHLREGFIETRGRSDAVAELISRSAAPLAVLMHNVARLPGAAINDAVLDRVRSFSAGGVLSSDEARKLFPEYLDAVKRLTDYIDRWGAA